ncbi:cytochrome c5 family protein [Azoarcus indigens]|uniref:Cytochrome c5 n=1 Tax=Azoarcus indigens TaxID=29545 RepID=A0A4R6DSX6_9RHOO|nr:c-type cytochrome [Azoarcus indigens]NMG66580.1 cytochrome c5 family protein [Azoarcus indigens]TDN48113.1 cytochrome c5 [Azoarcus indigens]
MKNAPLLIAALLAASLAACGGQESPPTAPAAAPAPPPVAAAPAAPHPGESSYKKVCAMCHSAGVAGAPKPGDKADWGPRIAQGKDTLYKHALEGFTGQKGMMPARGGAATMPDEDVKAAVDFMVSKSE